MSNPTEPRADASAPLPPVSRAGVKLAAALDAFNLSLSGLICADLGSNAGGFVEVMLKRGAARVHAVERGYGLLHARLRGDPRVVPHERTDALRLFLQEPVDFVSIDMGWTRQARVLPIAVRILRPQAVGIVSLIKPHYEAPHDRVKCGILPPEEMPAVLDDVRTAVRGLGLSIVAEIISPIEGQGGNTEYLWHLRPQSASAISDLRPDRHGRHRH